MQRPSLNRRLSRSNLNRYVLDGEHEILAQRRHWAAIAEPVGTAGVALLLVLVVDYFLPTSAWLLSDILWWGWFFLVARAVWRWLTWRRDWLVATDKRLLLTYGLLTERVAMMPLTKVTDMSYNRSPMGRLLGYGTFVMESAGQDQALRRVAWVKHPDHTYRLICAEIFEVEYQDRELDEHNHRFEDGPPPHTPGLYADYVPPGEHRDLGGSEDPDVADDSIGIKVRYGASPQGERDTWYQSPDLRGADTGPIPYRRPTTDQGDGWRPTTNEPKGDHHPHAEHQHDHDHDRDHDRDRDHDHDRDRNPDAENDR